VLAHINPICRGSEIYPAYRVNFPFCNLAFSRSLIETKTSFFETFKLEILCDTDEDIFRKKPKYENLDKHEDEDEDDEEDDEEDEDMYENMKYELLLDYSILANYDGKGSCKEMIFRYVTDLQDFETIKELLSPWAKAVNWKFTNIDDWNFIIKRKE